METVLAFLLATSLTCAGLVAIWAANSPRHWFLRTAVFVGLLSLLLLIPTFEPFVAFVLQGAVVAAGFQLIRREQHGQKPASDSPVRPRYSLLTLLLTMALVAIAAAVASRLPVLNFRAWQSVVLIGLTGGFATLIGLWIIHGRQSHWWIRLTLGTLLAACVSLPLVLFDRFLISAIRYPTWPPVETGLFPQTGAFSGYPGSVWVPIIVASVLITSGMLLLYRRLQVLQLLTTYQSLGWELLKKQQLTRATFCAVALVLVAMPAAMFYRLMTPLPIPEIQTPESNGYDDIVAAGKLTSKESFNRRMVDSQGLPTKELSAAVLESKPAYERLAVGLAKEILLPVDFTSVSPMTNYGVQAIRILTRALEGRSLLASSEGRIFDATESYSEAIRLGCEARRGGLPIDTLVCIACARVGLYGIISLREEIPLQLCTDLTTMLATLDKHLEPEQDVLHRDRVMSQNAKGWHGHFIQIFDSDDSLVAYQKEFLNACDRERTAMRLLQVELALRAWNLTRDSLPQSLSELVPKYLSEVPVDPYDPANGSLRYRLTEDSYLLYSVGQNGIDEQGATPDDYDFSEADLLLDYLYADIFLMNRFDKDSFQDE